MTRLMDEKRFKSCFMPLHKQLYAYALSILENESDAADCLQEAFTKLWENRSRISQVENHAAYATITVKHVALTMMARAGRKPFVDSVGHETEVADSAPDPTQSIEAREDVRNMAALLRQLPENQRRVIMMSGVAGLSNNEIAEATGFSGENVRVLLFRGRKRLRELFSRLSSGK